MSDDTTDTHVDNAEPSMEDILASIRRIIADEDVAQSGEDVEAPAKTPAESFTIVHADGVDVDDEAEASASAIAADADASHDAAAASLADDMESLTEDFEAADVIAEEEDDMFSDLDILLTDLDDENVLDSLDLDILDVGETIDVVPEANAAPKLTGLGAVAAAGLGAVASAGAATATGLTEAKKTFSSRDAAEDLVEDLGADNALETLDLMLEDGDILSDTALEGEPELNELLKIPEIDEQTAAAEDDIEALLGDMLLESEEGEYTREDDRVLDPAAYLLEDDNDDDDISDELLADLLDDEVFSETERPVTAQSPDDLDLVKSLMADLTEDPYELSEHTPIEGEAEQSGEADLLDDILALSMDDEAGLVSADAEPTLDAETELSSEALDDEDEPAPVSNPFIIDIREDLSARPVQSESAERPALADIAKAAEADAARIERRSGFAATGFAAGAGMMVASAAKLAASKEDVKAKSQSAVEISDEDNSTPHEAAVDNAVAQDDITPEQETADMAKAAAKKDTIIDEVTEEATAGAFASLNKMVQTQAVVADRGDRIGDLVQEALRPMLKEWLDKNLKGIVERAVTKEVKRISSGK